MLGAKLHSPLIIPKSSFVPSPIMLLVSRDSLLSAVGRYKSNAGRNKGDVNMTPAARAITGAMANLTTIDKAAGAAGISSHHTHELKHGKLSQDSEPDPSLRKAIDRKLDGVENKLVDVLEDTIGLIEKDDIAMVSVLRKTQIASNLSGVLAKISSRRADAQPTLPTVIMYTPETKPVESFEVIEVATDGNV